MLVLKGILTAHHGLKNNISLLKSKAVLFFFLMVILLAVTDNPSHNG